MPQQAGLDTLGWQVMVVAWSTFGPHPIGCERFLTVSNGTSFAQATAAILRKQSLGQNPDKDEVPGSSPGRSTTPELQRGPCELLPRGCQ